jgi:hypothetical protein
MSDERLRAVLGDADAAVHVDPARLLELLPAIEAERARSRRRSSSLVRRAQGPWLSAAAAIALALGVGAFLVATGRFGPAVGPSSLVPLPGFEDLSLTPPWIRPNGGTYIRGTSTQEHGRLTETWLGSTDVASTVARYLDTAPEGLTLLRTDLPDGGVRLEARDTDPALTIEVHPTTRLGMITEVDVVIADVPGGPFEPPATDQPTGGLS